MNWNTTTIREAERGSIRDFIAFAGEHGVFEQRMVLDVGCGQQPYRDVVEKAGGLYFGYDHPEFPTSVVQEAVGDQELLTRRWGAVMTTQVIQCQPQPEAFLRLLHSILEPGGALVITWSSCWDELEPEDHWRFTRTGGLELLRRAGFARAIGQRRAEVELGGFRFCLGHGAIAWK